MIITQEKHPHLLSLYSATAITPYTTNYTVPTFDLDKLETSLASNTLNREQVTEIALLVQYITKLVHDTSKT